MIEEILKYDKYEFKKTIEPNNNDYKISEKIIDKAEKKIMDYIDFINSYTIMNNYEKIKLAISILSLVEKYKKEDLILNAIKNVSIDTSGNNILKQEASGYYIVPKPNNLFTDELPNISKPTIVLLKEFEKKKLKPIEKQIVLLHELRHHITSINDTRYYMNDKNLWFQRTGLSQSIVFKKENKEFFINLGLGIDEVTNVYQSEQLLKTVLELKNTNFKNEEISKYLKTLRNPYKDGKYRDTSYYFLSLLMAPLLNNDLFIELMDYHALNGDLNQLESSFNNYYGELIDYISFCKNLDLFIRLNEKDIIENKKEVNKLKIQILEMGQIRKI